MNYKIIDGIFDVILEQLGKIAIIGLFVYDFVKNNTVNPELLIAVTGITAGVNIVNKFIGDNENASVPGEPTRTNNQPPVDLNTGESRAAFQKEMYERPSLDKPEDKKDSP